MEGRGLNAAATPLETSNLPSTGECGAQLNHVHDRSRDCLCTCQTSSTECYAVAELTTRGFPSNGTRHALRVALKRLSNEKHIGIIQDLCNYSMHVVTVVTVACYCHVRNMFV